MARRPNPGFLPAEAEGKRVRIWFPDGREARCDDNPMSPAGWAADGRSGCRWSLRGSPFDIKDYEVIE